MDVEDLTLKPGSLLVSAKRNYKVVCVLGSGGSGVTYLAKGKVKVDNVMVDGLFAVKELFPQDFARRIGQAVVPDPDKAGEFTKSKSDFIQEATRLQKIGTHHDNIVKVNEIFEANGTAYYVMQYVNGESLYDYVVKHGALDFGFAVSLLLPVLSAVEFLHDNRINHFDIKPDNIMLQTADGGIQPVLIDFGLSIHYKKNGGKTAPKAFFGLSEGYAPIEQYAEICHFSPRTDVYALAATLCYMLTGQAPAAAPSMRIPDLRERLSRIVPAHALDAICRAMSKVEDTRTPSVARFRKELTGLAVNPPVSASIMPGQVVMTDDDCQELQPVDIVKSSGNRKWIRWIAGGVASVAIVFGIVSWLSIIHTEPASSSGAVIGKFVGAVADGLAAITAGTGSAAGTDTTLSGEIQQGAITPEPDSGENKFEASPATASAGTPSRPPHPEKPQVTTGSVSLRNGVYTGALRNGKPHGKGRVVYNAEGPVDPYVPETVCPGYTLEGYWNDGLLESGSLYDDTGKKIKTIIP